MHQTASTTPRVPDLMHALAHSLGIGTIHQLPMPPAHGGYPGEAVTWAEYLACVDCSWAYTLDSMSEHEDCGQCGGPLEFRRVMPAPPSTIPMFRRA